MAKLLQSMPTPGQHNRGLCALQPPMQRLNRRTSTMHIGSLNLSEHARPLRKPPRGRSKTPTHRPTKRSLYQTKTHAGFLTIGQQRRCSRSGRRRTGICHQLHNGDVGLVTDCRDNGHGASVHRLGKHEFVEGPEVLERATAAGQNNGIDVQRLVRSVHTFNGLGNAIGCCCALNRNIDKQQRARGESSFGRCHHIMDGRARRRGQHGNAPRIGGQRLLLGRIKVPLRSQLIAAGSKSGQ